ncbi:MAG: GntR family transcriptional regulator [Clostridia bacterium]|nr:GntR family transcriptional regulator [Clostridia bacterium]
MREGAFRDSDRLPRESMLAEMLNISRTQLRDSLAELEREGFISRRQGVGTIINRHVLSVPVRMDLEIEFMDMIRRSGKTPAEKLIKVSTVLSATAAAKLGIGRTDEMLLVSRTVTADGKPVIYCEDYIPKSLILKDDYSAEELEKPIFGFLKEYCNKDAYLDITEIRPALAKGLVAKRLGVTDGSPLLYMDELDYDFEGLPVMYSRQFYVDGIIAHNVVRRKI